ncbi:phage tail protein [Rhodococcus fascians]|nr:phage tail protein [Rhodococcus fascians]MBY4396889.1 phage tail protein [Rhodococcus fascians]MBY4407368.1 phage tail protein [Rhodococcus fascians]MBY4421503.1 phage tail protein [Rhodococcus fascians]MBY4460744.1 phage tail protein [Rhodococcus fascians]
MRRTVTKVELEGVNGRFITLSGEGSDESSTYLATGMSGFMDVPVEVLRGSHAFQEGSSYLGKRILERPLEFGVVIDSTNGEPWQENDSEFRLMWSHDEDCKLWIETETSRRYLKIRPLEFTYDIEYDPNQTQIETVKLKLVAMDPWWYEEDYTATWVATEDTTDGHFQLGTIPAVNRSHIEVYPEWLLQAPGIPRLPDFSWGDKRHNGYGTNGYFDAATVFATRQIVMAELLPNFPVRVETRPDARDGGFQSGDQSYRQRMQMVRFLYPIPAHTAAVQLPVGMSKALPGTGIQLRIPQPWSRPWGLQA